MRSSRRSSPGSLAGDALAVAALDNEVHRFVLGGSLVRVKIWDEDGRILYSDAAALDRETVRPRCGRAPRPRPGRQRGPGSELEEPENALEADFGKLLEVYLGLRTTTGQPVLFEAYFRYDDVVSAGWDTWRRFAPLAVGALLALELVQVPLAVALARRLQRGSSAVGGCSTSPSGPPMRNGGGSPATCTTASCRTSPASPTSWTPRGSARPLLPTADERDAALAEAARRLRGCVRSLRTLLLDIYPPNLSAEGLGPALADLAASASTDQLIVEAHLGTSRSRHRTSPPCSTGRPRKRSATPPGTVGPAGSTCSSGRPALGACRRRRRPRYGGGPGRGAPRGGPPRAARPRRAGGGRRRVARLRSAPDAGTRVEVRVPAQ